MFTFREFLLAENNSINEGHSKYDAAEAKYEFDRNNPKKLSNAERKRKQKVNDDAATAAEAAVDDRLSRAEQTK